MGVGRVTLDKCFAVLISAALEIGEGVAFSRARPLDEASATRREDLRSSLLASIMRRSGGG